MTDRRYRLLQDAARLRPELSVPTREGARIADEVFERSKDTLSRLFRGEFEMTDQRYTGPDGAKRLEMLEELAAEIVAWKFSINDTNWSRLNRLSTELRRDNERVEQLTEKREK